jgi:hypothetical protein
MRIAFPFFLGYSNSETASLLAGLLWMIFSERNPHMARLIAEKYMQWEARCDARFQQVKANEERLNRIFIDLYGLHDELTPQVQDRDVSVRRADLQRDIKSLISYAVGCIFGRYCLDEEGLVYAGGHWDISRYQTIIPLEDNIGILSEESCFEDDLPGRFFDFVETVYGTQTLEENLRFIAGALGGTGDARDVIRRYFCRDFYGDHLRTYQKRPIYWLFSSGRKNGFKALIYIHRYRPSLLTHMTQRVHRQQAYYGSLLERKPQKRMQEQAQELARYEEKLQCLARQGISLDLDAGVKANYERFGDLLERI